MKRRLPRFRKQIAGIFMMAFTLLLASNAYSQPGQMLNFDGVDDYVILPDPTIVDGSYTKEVWIRVPTGISGSDNILSSNVNALFINNGQLTAGHFNAYNAVQDPTPLVANTWTHVAVTYDAATNAMILYKNGVQVDAGTALPNSPSSSLNLSFFAGGNYFTGDMDEVRIWDGVRTPQEIFDNYLCTMPPSAPGLLAYFDFNQGTAGGNNTGITLLNDLTPNNNDGTLTNFALTGSASNFLAPGAPLSGGNCTILPVTLSAFTASIVEGGVSLQWQTSAEINNAGFDIERSANGSTGWISIGSVAGAGSTNQAQEYTFTDPSPLSGNNYYRLNQKDFDGRSVYSKVVSVNFSEKISGLSLYPTVATSQITLSVTDRALLHTPVVILNNQGKVMQRLLLDQMKKDINISRLQSGMYFLKTENGKVIKFIKQ